MESEETRFGKCEWCGKHNVLLHSIVGQHEGKIYAGWICSECLQEKQKQQWGDIYDKIFGMR